MWYYLHEYLKLRSVDVTRFGYPKCERVAVLSRECVFLQNFAVARANALIS